MAEVPEPGVRPGGVLVRNAVSLISAGTEKMVIDFAGKSLLGKAQERPDLVRQVLDKVKKDGVAQTLQTVLTRLDEPLPLGYSCAGIVAEVGKGAEEFSVGDRVACAGMGYASHAEVVFVPKNLTVPIPDAVSLDDASFVTLGAIALQGVRITAPTLGENVVVIGLGVLGLLTIQILKANGCRTIGVDLDPAKVALAKELGCDLALTRDSGIEAAVERFSDGIGADAVVITAAADTNDPIELAAQITRERGRVTIVGAVKMDVPRKPFYDKELDLRLSRSYGPGRYDPEYEEAGHDYPIGYVRWTERRNMQEFLRLVANGQVHPSRLVSHRFGIEQASAAYDLIGGRTREPYTGILLTYPDKPRDVRQRTIRSPGRALKAGQIGVGFIGAGNFARGVLLPRFAKARGVSLRGIATANGRSAKATGDKFGFAFATTDISQVLGDPEIQAVVIATRHGSHARLAGDALRAGKAVFLEKPVAIDEEGLASVLAATRPESLLTVGFNRRFSPLAKEMKSVFAPDTRLAVNYRVNAGAVPADSWVHDPNEGGGRIIGEVCHFMDFIQFLTDDTPIEISAYGLGGAEGALNDTLTVSVRLSRGSLASIGYFANGDKTFPKERVEVFGGGNVAVLDDFRELRTFRGGKRSVRKGMSQQKGYDEEIDAFLAAIRGEAPPPISLDSLAATTVATFAIERALRTGEPVTLSRG
ncbi:MAG TPA: bi-domain-containing oxidoreductase [Gemmatimonadaceae bacterium]|nr:bi-domain-containing oxidoreductase [Gemmatimonadaceae bacterium]